MVKRLIKLLISIIYFANLWIFNMINKLLRRGPAGTCVVLYYHSISQNNRNRFAKQMDDIIRWARPIPLDKDVVFDRGIHYVGVTFDDGFYNVIENALPELFQRKIHATIFVPTGFLGQHPEWINSCKKEERNEVIISADQLKKLKGNAMLSVGSHCVTHSRLPSLSDEAARNEIFNSKYDLERILGEDIKIISFPHGSFDQKHLELAREAGYKRVFSIVPNFFSSYDFLVGRIKVNPNEWRLEFILKLLGGYCWLPVAISSKGIIQKFINAMFDKKANE